MLFSARRFFKCNSLRLPPPPRWQRCPSMPLGGYWFCEGRKGRDRLFRDPCNRPVPALIVRDVVFDDSFALVWVGGFLNTALLT